MSAPRRTNSHICMKNDDGSKRGLGRQTVVRQKPMVNNKTFGIVPKGKDYPQQITSSNNLSKLKPAPNAMKIYNDFQKDQFDTLYFQRHFQKFDLPNLESGHKEDNKLAYTVPALAVLALLTTMMDDKPMVDLLPETMNPSTLTSGIQVQQQQMVDYFG